MPDTSVCLLGLDIGSTTTHMMIAQAELMKNCVTGRMEFSSPTILFKSEPVFTPFAKQEIDLAKLSKQITTWLTHSSIDPRNLKGGGAIVTGLASKKDNAAKIKGLVKELVSESIVATAEDPHLESWLAFKGNCQNLSTDNPTLHYLNLDIGGGTTNIALGKNGEVYSTGCLFIGARHLQFKQGTYQLTSVSEYGKRLLSFLKINNSILEPTDINLLAEKYVSDLERVVTGNFIPEMESLYDYTPSMQLKVNSSAPILTYSGGVGELLYQYAQTRIIEGTTKYGDFGEVLARAILKSKVLSKDLKTAIPTNLGRATVFGMTLYQVEVSGSTTYLSDPALLPLEDIPIVATLDLSNPDEILFAQLQLLYSAGHKGGVYIQCNQEKAREQFSRLANLLKIPKETSVVFFMESNLGKTLGNYLTDWGKSGLKCIVVDEVPLKSAQFASLGRMLQNSIPVSFYGMK